MRRYFVIEHPKRGMLTDLEWNDATQKCDKPKFAWSITCTDISAYQFTSASRASEVAGEIEGAYVLQIEKGRTLRITDLNGNDMVRR